MKNLLRKLMLLPLTPFYVIAVLVWVTLEWLFNNQPFHEGFAIADDVYQDLWQGGPHRGANL